MLLLAADHAHLGDPRLELWDEALIFAAVIVLGIIGAAVFNLICTRLAKRAKPKLEQHDLHLSDADVDQLVGEGHLALPDGQEVIYHRRRNSVDIRKGN